MQTRNLVAMCVLVFSAIFFFGIISHSNFGIDYELRCKWVCFYRWCVCYDYQGCLVSFSEMVFIERYCLGPRGDLWGVLFFDSTMTILKNYVTTFVLGFIGLFLPPLCSCPPSLYKKTPLRNRSFADSLFCCSLIKMRSFYVPI